MLWVRTIKGRSMYRLKNRGDVCLEHPFLLRFSPGRNVSVAGGPETKEGETFPVNNLSSNSAKVKHFFDKFLSYLSETQYPFREKNDPFP